MSRAMERPSSTYPPRPPNTANRIPRYAVEIPVKRPWDARWREREIAEFVAERLAEKGYTLVHPQLEHAAHVGQAPLDEVRDHVTEDVTESWASLDDRGVDDRGPDDDTQEGEPR